jgi:aldose 1-epimerase
MAAAELLGTIDGTEVRRITLSGRDGFQAQVLTYGARVSAILAPDKAGALADVVLGYDRLSDWHSQGGYLGATCGRYANRIADGRFFLGGREVLLDRNEGAQHLHGGMAGLDAKHWMITDHSVCHVTLCTILDDGDMGYPGRLTAEVTYLVQDLGLQIVMKAQTDAPTVVNMVNHAYFNLAGQGAGHVLEHELQVDADFFLPVDSRLIPTGEVLSVTATEFDFRLPRPIGAQMPGPGGFDHNLCLSAPLQADGLRPCLSVTDPASGRRLRIRTTEPGVQFYTGGHFNGAAGKSGVRYDRFAGFAAETQRFPNSPNVPHFPSPRLDPGQDYRHETWLDFTPDA